jgi:ribose 5-phosphate isomerase B
MPGKIAVANDHAGLVLKAPLIRLIGAIGWEFENHGTDTAERVDYPDYASCIVQQVASAQARYGLLLCGTGVGMAIAANRSSAIRAVVCSEPFSARMARAHNDANVLCLGARVVTPERGCEILRAFLETDYEGGRHAARVAKLGLP